MALSEVLEERKVVSVVFCDLVGFTAASENADPEDVRTRLRRYHERLRPELERYGGTVEKFVGDAVMAVFGAPVAHEDDTERAVRAGLRVLEAMDELNEADPTLALQVRIGVATGEAVVALAARPEVGEGFVTGDVVNTAARLQEAAPVGTVVVCETTYRSAERVFEFEPLGPATVKGKAAPLALWRALHARSRLGAEVGQAWAAPLVGREPERVLLIDAFERSVRERVCQLVTVVGEPGVGKSRLCAELLAHVEAQPELVRWRQGRCLPYGEGISFWALGEILKAECGILESDSPEDAVRELRRALPGHDPESAWLRSRLLPLLGVSAEPVSQAELFTAWRRYLESLAAERPTVVVFEDLHWADEALLLFLEHLADWATDTPLLVLCAARPELYERHRNWAAGLRNAVTINIPPLSDEETARLIACLCRGTSPPTATRRQLLERAGGNPLYAEEFVRFHLEGGPSDDVPPSLQALIAARLDTLPADRKSLLQDASVIGTVFWAGAVAEMGHRDPAAVDQTLHELARKELVRPVRSSSIAGENEYCFWHALVRDVCYGQIPRAGRAARHRGAAEWLERQAGGRATDFADVLAHHYLQALDLTRAAGTPDVRELEEAAIHHLRSAGERALPLDVERAEQHLAKALELAPSDGRDRAALLESWSTAVRQRGRLPEARRGLEKALVLYRASGDANAAGRVLTTLSNVLRRLGDPAGEAAAVEALSVLGQQPPGPDLVAAYGELASRRAIATSDFEAAMVAAERALTLADELALPVPARALGYRGLSRCHLGDRGGMNDLRRAAELALESGDAYTSSLQLSNLAEVTWEYEGPRAGLAVYEEARDQSERRGHIEVTTGIAVGTALFRAHLGETAAALAAARTLTERLRAADDLQFTATAALELHLLVETEHRDEAPSPDALLAAVRTSGEPQMYACALAAAAELALANGAAGEAQALLVELAQIDGKRHDAYYVSVLPASTRSALALEQDDLAAALLQDVEPRTPLARHALASCRAQLCEYEGDHRGAAALYMDAAGRWHRFGVVPERAYALLGHGRCLLTLREPPDPPLATARELFRSIGYHRALTKAEQLAAVR